jgi:hypothetical protein
MRTSVAGYGFAVRSRGLVADRVKIGQAWSVDIRVKSFVPEAAGRLDFLRAEYGFTGPEVVPDEAGAYPLLRTVRYQRTGLAIEISLVLSYMGEEYVATELVSEDGSGSVRRTQIGSGAAPWTGRRRPCGAYSGANPARTVEPHAA